MGGDGGGAGLDALNEDEADFFGDNNHDDDLDVRPKKKKGNQDGYDNNPLAFL